MVLTRSELISSLQHEVHILVHLAGKIDRARLDYRPTSTQRTTLELLQYLSIMGPAVTRAAKAGGFDPAAWGAADAEAKTRDFDQTIAVIAGHSDLYAQLLSEFSEEDFRREISMFGRPAESAGSLLVNIVLCGHAAYRTQLFNYLKACGREEMTTMNLWAGMDAPAKAM